MPPWTDCVELHWSSGEAYVTPVDDECVGIAILSSQHGGFDAQFHEFLALRGISYWVVNTALTELRARCDRGSRAALPGESYSSVTRRVTRTHLPEGLGPAFGAAELLVQCVVADRPGDYDHQWRRMTRRYRALTAALLRAGACPPLRAGIVPAAHAWPNLLAASSTCSLNEIRQSTLWARRPMRLLKVPHYEMLGGREELERSLPDFQPIVRAIEPREVAGPAAFLLSNLASAMTGTAVGVDVGVLENA